MKEQDRNPSARRSRQSRKSLSTIEERDEPPEVVVEKKLELPHYKPSGKWEFMDGRYIKDVRDVLGVGGVFLFLRFTSSRLGF